VLGSHIAQAGSLVEPDRLRFDFTHFEAITPEQLKQVEDLVNDFILRDRPVSTEEMAIEDAKKRGATALFGEKYGDTVRVVSIEPISMELCGGTHAFRTGQIGSAKIVSESSIGAGLRRIEAVTGMAAVNYNRMLESTLTEAALALKASPVEVPEKISRLQEQIRGLERQMAELRRGQAVGQADQLLAKVEEIGGVKVLAVSAGEMDADSTKSLIDGLIDKLGSGVVILGSQSDGKLFFAGKLSQDLVSRGFHVGNIIREVARVAGGGGGGRPDFAQAGGRDVAKLGDALAKAKEVIQAQASKAK
jgi:alanyl-tRNA synthetase